MSEILTENFYILLSLIQWAQGSQPVLLPKQSPNTMHKKSHFKMLVGERPKSLTTTWVIPSSLGQLQDASL